MPEASNAAKSSLEKFIKEEEVLMVLDWLACWNDQKNYISRA